VIKMQRLGVILAPDQPEVHTTALFNAGMARDGDTVHMLYRYAEWRPSYDPQRQSCYAVDEMRYARLSPDGRLIEDTKRPVLAPSLPWDSSGCQDARIVPFEGYFYLFYCGWDKDALIYRRSTIPRPPSTRTRSPVFRRMVASPQPTTAGMPSSRATMAAWLSGAPRSVTMAAARGKSGVQPMLVMVVTSTSPACNWLLSSRQSRRRTVPFHHAQRAGSAADGALSPRVLAACEAGTRASNSRCAGWGPLPRQTGRSARR
jgi:hypothetical protein